MAITRGSAREECPAALEHVVHDCVERREFVVPKKLAEAGADHHVKSRDGIVVTDQRIAPVEMCYGEPGLLRQHAGRVERLRIDIEAVKLETLQQTGTLLPKR